MMSRFGGVIGRAVASVRNRAARGGAKSRRPTGLGAGGMPLKATAEDCVGRFREIVSDPLNLLIARDPRAGVVEDGHVYLHNGNRVDFAGPQSYYGGFSDVLIINRGVHEPTEEYVFQEMLRVLPPTATMLELGAYWGHYSMWLKAALPESRAILVEADPANIAVGRHNFALNGHRGEFIRAMVGTGHFTVDGFLESRGMAHLDVLHSDIQGSELEMLDGADQSLRRQAVDYAFVSTHSDALHATVRERLAGHGYVVEVACDYETDTTSYDGLVFARSPKAKPVVPSLRALGRLEIAAASPAELVRYLGPSCRFDSESR